MPTHNHPHTLHVPSTHPTFFSVHAVNEERRTKKEKWKLPLSAAINQSTEYFSKPTLEPTFFSFHSSKCCCDAAVEGSKSVPSKPDSPWIPGSCRGDLSNGTFWPETTFTFSTPAACNTRAALAVVCVVRSVGGGQDAGNVLDMKNADHFFLVVVVYYNTLSF